MCFRRVQVCFPAWRGRRAVPVALLVAAGVSASLPGALAAPVETEPPAAMQSMVAFEHVLAEAEQAFRTGRPAEAAPALELALARIEQGEHPPAGVVPRRLWLAAATAHFHGGRLDRAAELAARVVADAAVPAAEQADARLILGLALARLERFGEALPVFVALETSPTHRDPARRYRAWAAQAAGDRAAAVEAWEAFLSGAPRDHAWGEGALALIGLHLEQGALDAASRGLALLRGDFRLIDNLAGLEVLSLQLGDAWLLAGDPDAALAAYDVVGLQADVVAAQTARNARLAADLEQARRIGAASPAAAEERRRLENRLAAAQAALATIEAEPGYDGALLFRRAQAFLRADRPWEAAIVLEHLIEQEADATGRGRSIHALVQAYANSRRPARAAEVISRFLDELEPNEVLADAVAIAAAGLAETREQLALIDRALSQFGDSAHAEPLLLLQCNTLFAAGEHDAVRAAREDYVTRFPRGRFCEELDYLNVMAGLVAGGTGRAVTELEDFLRRYPEGRFVADARYRLATARFGVEDHAGADRACAAWLADFPAEHPQRGEVLALAGDVAVARGEVEQGLAHYHAALATALPDELLGYVLDEVTGLHERRGEHAEAARVWQDFATQRPDHPFVIHAAYWIGRLRARDGQTAEAVEEVAAIMRRFLSDPHQDALERLLGEFPGLVLRAARERPRDEASPEAGPLPEATSAATDWETLSARIADALLANDQSSPTALARVKFAQAELAALLKEDARQRALWDEILADAPVEGLPAGLLGRLGDHAAAEGQVARARVLYERIVQEHPTSIFADFGYTGLGELELRAGHAAEALRRFDAAIDRAGARFKLREATLGRARALLELGRWEESRDVFQSVAANRQWRGAATAESVFALGEILFRQGGAANLAQAQAHFQRVYLTYRKYGPWAVRAYLRSADTFEQLGQHAEAAATLRELLRDPELSTRAEAALAGARLAQLEASAATSPGGGS